MTANRWSETSGPKKSSLMAIAMITIFAIAAFFLTRPQTSMTSLSPLSGLMALKATAQAAMPYETAIANQKPTLIEFYADWCTTCQAMAPTLQALHYQFDSDLNFVMLNIDAPQWRDQVQQFQVKGVPHLVLLDGEQAIVDTFIGEVPRSILLQRVADLLG